jgi:hypothetical protein
VVTAAELKVPAGARAVFDEITEITDLFCRTHLDAEYEALCAKLTAKLCRKRPSPLLRGDRGIWAAAIVYTIGRVNFLSDPSQVPHLRVDDLAAMMGVKQATMTGKGRIIQDLLKIGPMDVEYYRPSQMESNPQAWLVSINGFLLDARGLPEDLQAECVARGLIPYMPGTR